MRHYTSTWKQSKRRASIIEEAMKNSVQYQLKYAETLEEKQTLIADRNPLLYAFGQTLISPAYEESYTDWVERSYTKEPQHITTKEEALEYIKNLATEVEHEQ